MRHAVVSSPNILKLLVSLFYVFLHCLEIQYISGHHMTAKNMHKGYALILQKLKMISTIKLITHLLASVYNSMCVIFLFHVFSMCVAYKWIDETFKSKFSLIYTIIMLKRIAFSTRNMHLFKSILLCGMHISWTFRHLAIIAIFVIWKMRIDFNVNIAFDIVIF